jgi:hypothetical protein
MFVQPVVSYQCVAAGKGVGFPSWVPPDFVEVVMGEIAPEPKSNAEDPLEELVLFWTKINKALLRITPDRSKLPERQAKLVKLAESHMTWGSVGLLAGSVESPWAKFWMPTACIVMILSVWRVNFLAGPNKKAEVAGNGLIAIILNFCIYRYMECASKGSY